MFDYFAALYHNEPLYLFQRDPVQGLPQAVRSALDAASDHLPPDFLPQLRAALRRQELDAFRTGAQFGGQIMLTLMDEAD